MLVMSLAYYSSPSSGTVALVAILFCDCDKYNFIDWSQIIFKMWKFIGGIRNYISGNTDGEWGGVRYRAWAAAHATRSLVAAIPRYAPLHDYVCYDISIRTISHRSLRIYDVDLALSLLIEVRIYPY